jgi:hypothetical protein
VLKEVYTCPPISELDYYSPKPSLDAENEVGVLKTEEQKKTEEKGL